MMFWPVLFTWVVATVRLPNAWAFRGHFGRLLTSIPGLRWGRRRDVGVAFWLVWFNGMALVFWAAGIDLMWVYVLDMARIVDDWLNHDDDSWRKFFEAVRNKVKWKMVLPAPARARSGTG